MPYFEHIHRYSSFVSAAGPLRVLIAGRGVRENSKRHGRTSYELAGLIVLGDIDRLVQLLYMVLSSKVFRALELLEGGFRTEPPRS